MIPSADMSRKQRPKGGMITVPADERPKIKAAREAKGWKQKDLGAKIGVSGPTISNVETGRHPQMTRVAYAKLRRVLFSDVEASSLSDQTYDFIVENAVDLDDAGMLAVRNLIEALRTRKKGGTS